jgi:hypothetical protein
VKGKEKRMHNEVLVKTGFWQKSFECGGRGNCFLKGDSTPSQELLDIEHHALEPPP